MNKHQDCKLFDHVDCEHKDDEIMKQATQTMMKYYGGKMPIHSFPSSKDIDAICSTCKKFTPK